MLVIATLLTAVIFAPAGLTKATDHPKMRDDRARFSITEQQWKLLGALEVLGAIGVLVGLAVGAIGIAAAAGLAVVSLGAVATHVRAGDPVAKTVPAGIGLVLAAVVIALHVSG